MFLFIRSYFIYIYYWFIIKDKRKNGSLSHSAGFIPVAGIFVLLIIGMYGVALVLFPEPAFAFYYALVEMTGRANTHKGTVNIGLLLLCTTLSLVLCYFVCCYRMPFEKIPTVLKRYKFLSEFSWWKLSIPYVSPLLIYLIYLIVN